MDNILYDTKNYCVKASGEYEVMDESGAYSSRAGYVVVNKNTGIVEHTTMIFPQAVYQAQGFSDSVDALLAKPADKEGSVVQLADMPTEDVVPN